MTLDQFTRIIEFSRFNEIEKVEALAFFLIKKENNFSFNIFKICEQIAALGYGKPNCSRLKSKLLKSKKFSKGFETNFFKLNPKFISDFEIKYQPNIVFESHIQTPDISNIIIEDRAAIQYTGEPGITEECKNGITRLLQNGDKIIETKILTFLNNHSLLLTINTDDIIAVKSGFCSGYIGEGPSGFSHVLSLLEFHGSEIKEYEVSKDLFERLDYSALRRSDIKLIAESKIIRPSRWRDYIFEKDWTKLKEGNLWKNFPLVLPYAIIDDRIVDLALSFWENPDGKLLKGYKRLEEIVRKKSGSNEHGTKLFSQAFKNSLHWKNLDESEKVGRISLFTSVYMVYRNPRAHRELNDSNGSLLLNEFLLLNNLYSLEAESIKID